MDPGAAGRWIVLLPGARWDNKRWPVENFVELARLMRTDERIAICHFGQRRRTGAWARPSPRPIPDAA